MRGFANSDFDRRRLKAQKIEHLVGGVAGLDLLDLGAGSGLLASYFATKGANVIAADRDGDAFAADCPFVQFHGELPFDAESFDLVVFNHVIEHVGGIDDQRKILAEIANVLRPGGRIYLAAPTKWAVIEPHFRIPLLGAMPRRIANLVVRAAGKGQFYDCFPLTARAMLNMMSEHFREVRDVSREAFDWAALYENPAFRYLPAIPGLFPTRMFIGTR
jgi:SAM-dependent methyltransferase